MNKLLLIVILASVVSQAQNKFVNVAGQTVPAGVYLARKDATPANVQPQAIVKVITVEKGKANDTVVYLQAQQIYSFSSITALGRITGYDFFSNGAITANGAINAYAGVNSYGDINVTGKVNAAGVDLVAQIKTLTDRIAALEAQQKK